MARFRDWMARNLGLKLLALGAAVALWSYVSLRPTAERALEARVDYTQVPAGLEINPDEVDRLTVIVAGTQDRLDDIGPGLTARVDFSDVYGPGEYTFNVTAERLALPRGVRLVKAVPSQVRLVLEKQVSREVAVEPHFSGTTTPGYTLHSYSVEPPQLLVTGPESRIALLGQLSTDAIDLSDVVGGRSFRTMAFVADPYVRFAQGAGVTVSVQMRKIP